jgi:lipoprotein-anchoring transpeptidase ErfK/SrfK
MDVSVAAPRRARGRAVAGLILLGCLSTAACSNSGTSPHAAAQAMVRLPISVTPQAGAAAVRPDAHVTVTVDRATLSHVDVTDSTGAYLRGAYSADHTRWTSSAPLAPSRDYAVSVLAIDGAGRSGTSNSTFHTEALPGADRLLVDQVTPTDGATFGIGYPLVVTFNHQVRNRQAVTAALDVETFPHVEGAWYWIDAATVDFRPQKFWPAGTVVTLAANLIGVNAGDDLWGGANRTSTFTVGRSQILDVNVKSDVMKVVRDGSVVASFNISSGKPGWETRNGIKVISEKITDKTWYSSAIGAPEPYVKHSQWAMRMTDSGEFIHDAPWNAKHMGEDNASHGCVGLLTDDMNWLFSHTIVGDPVVVTGSPTPFTEISNRIQDWNVPWERWVTDNLDLSDK